MVNHEQQDGKPAAPAAAPAIPPLSARGAARRRIAGLGVSGVVMTVASNNAMAALVCKSPSGALSGNLNSQAPASVSCEGLSPGYWKNHTESWPSEVRTNDRFSKFFACNGKMGGYSCLNILNKQEEDKHNVGMHVMATYLNVVSGKISFLTRQAVIDMWAEYNNDGVFTPTDGATPWTGDQLVTYLTSTQA